MEIKLLVSMASASSASSMASPVADADTLAAPATKATSTATQVDPVASASSSMGCCSFRKACAMIKGKRSCSSSSWNSTSCSSSSFCCEPEQEQEEPEQEQVRLSVNANAAAPPLQLQPAVKSSGVGKSRWLNLLCNLERSLLRTVASLLYQMDPMHAKFCVTSLWRMYGIVHTQLPMFAADSLDSMMESILANSEDEFVSFWLSLVEKERGQHHHHHHHHSHHRHHHLHHRHFQAQSQCPPQGAQQQQIQEYNQHQVQVQVVPSLSLVGRLYQNVHWYFAQLIVWQQTFRFLHTQTPLTSPDDRYEDRLCGSYGYRGRSHAADGNDGLETDRQEEQDMEPGWAIQYLEQESHIPSEMTRKMRQMMHCKIPLNLFRATVRYEPNSSFIDDENLTIGSISPESLPPTPLTREFQTRKMNRYTRSVLDHATLSLRLLQSAQSYSG